MMEEQFSLGWDFSTQQIKAIGVGLTTGKILFEEFLKFDDEMPHYKTKGGVHTHTDGVTVTSPTLMWVEALDRMLEQLKSAGVDFSRAAVICGAGQQHGSVYWRTGTRAVLSRLDPSKSYREQLAGCFSVADSPVWMDASTGEQCRALEEFVGGPEKLMELTGARAFHRYTAAQLMKQRETGSLADTERVSLVSSFAASLFLGDYAAIDEADASGFNLMSMAKRQWLPELCEFVAPGLESLLGPVVPGRTILGRVSPYLVGRWGFPASCRVAAFTGDNPASLAGLRLRPGSLAVTLGSSSCAFLWCSGRRHLVPGAALPSLGCVVMACAVDTEACMPIAVLKNGALTREAIRDQFASGSWPEFDALLDASPPGNAGRIGLYYDVPEIVPEGALGRYRFHGNQSSSGVEPLPAGADFGDPAAEVRACVEGHALALRHFAAALGYRPGGNGHRGAPVLVTGGASANGRILQILADVFAAPVVAAAGNSAALGAALIGASALRAEEAAAASAASATSSKLLPDFHDTLPPPPPAHESQTAKAAEPRPEFEPAYRQLRQRFAEALELAARMQLQERRDAEAASS